MKPAEDELELTRLLAAERGAEGEGIGLLRGQGPDAAQLASLSSRLALQGIDVSTPAASAAPQPWKKWAIGGGGGAAAVVLWLVLRAPQAALVAVEQTPEASAPAPDVAAADAKTPFKGGTATNARVGAPAASLAASPVSEPDVSAPAPPPEAVPFGTEMTPPARGATFNSSEASDASVPTAGRAKPTSGAVPAGAADSTAATPAAADAPTEIELLRDARFALKQSPARALELAEQHGRLYPGGKLTQERELIAISALVALGRRTAALSRGANFERAFPTSAYRKQVGELLR